jgi:hypothetical protein
MKIKESMRYSVSECGDRTFFKTFEESCNYCYEKKINDGENGLLWIYGSKNELNRFRNSGKFNPDYMRLTYNDDDLVQWVWCDIYKIWENWDAILIEDGVNTHEELYQMTLDNIKEMNEFYVDEDK